MNYPAIKKTMKQPKLSDVIVEQLESMILEGSLQPGEKLLSERELATKFSVSRPSLREAIQKLEAKNLVTRKQGGGTFVNEKISSGLTEPLLELIAKSDESQFDLLEYRHGMEGMAAYYAAMRGTEADYQDIQEKFDAIGVAQLEENIRLEAEAVADFYFAICAASHNVVFLQLTQSMSALMVDNIEKNLKMLVNRPDVFAKILDYRKNLLEAILSGQPQKAWGVSHRHLAFIEDVLLKLTQENTRIERSMRRI